MKKTLASVIIVLIFTMMPLVSFAKTAISDGELAAITAQEGVTIYFGGSLNGMMIDKLLPSTISWGQTGFTGYASAGYFGMKDFSADTNRALIYNSMTVDVGTNATGVTKMNIGLPVFAFVSFETNATIKLGTNKELSDTQPALGHVYGDQFIAMINSKNFMTSPSRNESIKISAHSVGQGLSIGFDNVIISVPGVPIIQAWGDQDGFTGYTSAGWAGVYGLTLGPLSGLNNLNDLITLSDTMDMDVGTSGGSVTALNVVLPTIQLGPLTMSAKLKPDSVNDLSSTRPSLGSLDVNGFSTYVTGSMKMSSH